MAKNYIDNLREEIRKGMLEKAEQRHYPSTVPIGYEEWRTYKLLIAIFSGFRLSLERCSSRRGSVGRMTKITIYEVVEYMIGVLFTKLDFPRLADFF